MKVFVSALILLVLSQNSFATDMFTRCVKGSLDQTANIESHFPSGKAIDGALMCATGDSSPALVLTSSDNCCYHRGADGTCYHQNPACSGCTCYHRGAGGDCYHCSCPQGCP